MLWIFSIVAFALLAINVQLLTLYRRRVHELRSRQSAPRRRIREHVEGMREATARTRALATARLEELTFILEYTRQRSEVLSRAISGLEEQFAVASEAPPTAEGRPGRAAGPQTELAESRENVRQLRRQQEEIGGNLTSMRREIEIVRRTMERIEARVQRYVGTPREAP